MVEELDNLTPTRWWQWLLVYPAALLAVLGAIPKYAEWWTAYRIHAPFGTVQQAQEQRELWEKNYDCTRKTKSFAARTDGDALVEVTVCPSGDMLVKLMRPSFPETPTYRWIGLKTFSLSAGLEMGGSEAVASPLLRALQQMSRADVLCQQWTREGLVYRVMRYSDGQCWEEWIDPYTGRVVQTRFTQCHGCQQEGQQR